MGVPKFYRWISERYPCLSEVVTEYQIPDFDNLYLDMNGIIHPCSHPNDDDPHFRITEDQIFANICHYIEFLFKMIKPKKVFFMAVDGVAPRAKMNQQRGRRFRTAKTALILEEQAIACGESLPTDAKFDSNCITPGTPFMARLHKCLQDFVVYKISSDNLWRGVRVYLSGHETPGEGEHKVMDFIRYEKSQPGYNPNTRHCLYGLDADLIMLGLCSHEPHFCLLREEVKFGGKKNQKRILTPEETTFHLLHISLLRDYLFHEFSPVKNKLSFTYDVEKVIDDFVLMSFLVGNDFIPHLPQLHIHHDALPVLFQTYITVLPKLGGYINEGGFLNLERFEAYLTELAEYDFQKFSELNDDFTYLEGKSKSREKDDKNSTSNLLSELGFSNLAISKTAEYDSPSEDENSEEESTLELEFNMHKTDYYMNKLEFDEVTPDVLKEQAEGYIRAIQWNLHYYYNGVVSWSWYYPHHYSPFISDVKNFKNMKMEFEMGKPFLPFQQLLSVLPKLSKELLPESYQKLMCDKDSPLYDCYPDDFLTDLNGKQQEWEAIVLIPFINENLLLKCAANSDKCLTPEEKQRNRHGPHLLYTYNSKISNGPFSFLPNHYHSISDTHAEVKKIEPNFFRLSPKCIVKGLCKGVVLDSFILGFPTLNTLKHSARLQNEKVKVFNMVSMKDNMMLTIEEAIEFEFKKIAQELIGKTVFVGWPHLREALVVTISDGRVKYDYERVGRSNAPLVAIKELTKDQQKIWARQCESIQEQSYQRWGIFTGEINVLVFAKCFSGVKYNLLNADNVQEEKQFEGSLVYYPVQTVVWKKQPFSLDYSAAKSINDIFSIGSVVFLLTPQYYGSKGRISNNDLTKNKGCVIVDVELTSEPDLMPIMLNQEHFSEERFMPGYVAAQQLGVDSHFFSRVTGTLLVQTSPKESSSPNRVNIGLNLKFNRKNEEVQGFTKKKDNSWLYSDEAVIILNDYFTKFANFFEKLYRFVDKDVIYIEDLYPVDEGTEIINQITAWLKEQTCSLAERQECGMNKLDSGIISAIDNVVQNFVKDDVYHVKKSIQPHLLYNPLLSKGKFIPEQKQSFYLFDRVLNIRPSSSVPLGLKGTIVGIQKAEKDSDFIYEILFDKEFIGGMTICPGSKKGYRLPPDAVINLTHGIKMQKQNTNSPVKSRVIAPRLSRTHLFDTAVKQSLTQNSPAPNIPKAISQSPYQGKPFYQADISEPLNQYNQLSDSTYLNMKISNSSNQHFVTPNANQFNRGVATGNSNSPLRQENFQSDFQNFWTNLKKRTPEAQPISNPNLINATPTQSHPEPTYGQKLSVEELFQSAQPHRVISESQNIQIMPNKMSPCVQIGAQDMLRQACLELFKQPPVYTYNNHGGTNFFAATIKLPNGEFVSSVPCGSKVEAAVNAAEKSLAVLKNSFLAKVFPPNKPLFRAAVSPNYQANLRPILLNQPPPPPHIPPPPVNFMPPPNIYHPPPVFQQFNPQQFQGSIMRHPASYNQSVPDSFVQANQPLLLSGSSYPPQQENFARALETNQNQTIPQNDIFHIPGCGTAMIKSQLAQKGNDSAFSSMFVPAQVMKQTAKNDRALSTSDWPNLPGKQANTPEQPVTETPTMEKIMKSFSGASKTTSESTPVKTENLENASHPTNMTVVNKKIPKRRIAANFQFS